jgi:demethylmenaquinone methyltransferase/2-methoxy-6-polyprenyl-1,4-benzoquinol methylase
MNLFDVLAPIYEKIHFGAKKTFDKIKSIVIFEPLDKVVDLGGGTGRIARFLRNKVQKITVVDTSEGMLKQCRRRHPELSCVHAEAQNLPFADDSINKVIVIDAFHHFQNQKQVVKEIKRVLAKNSKVVVEEFNPLKITGKLVIIMEKLFLMGSIFHTPLSLADLFSSNGFKVRLIDENRASYYLIGEKI